MKRIILGVLLLLVCLLGGLLWLGQESLLLRLHRRLEDELSRALHTPTHIDTLTVSVRALEVQLGGIVVGTEPALARIVSLDVRVLPIASLAEGRPVVIAAVRSPQFDLSRLAHGETGKPGASTGGGAQLPPLHFKHFEVEDGLLRFPFGNTTASLEVGRVAGEMKTGLLSRRMTGSVEARRVVLERHAHRLAIDELRAQGGSDAHGLFVDTATVRSEGLAVDVRAASVPGEHAASASFDPALLGVFVDELALIGGQAHLEGTLAGDLANPRLDGRVVVQQATIANRTLGDLETRARRDGTTLRFDEVRLTQPGGEVTGSVELIIEKDVPIRGQLGWQGVDLQSLLAITGVSVPLADRFDATTATDGSLDPLDLRVSASGVLRAGEAGMAKDARWEISGRIRPRLLEAGMELTQLEHNRLGVKFALDGPKLGGSIDLDVGDLAAFAGLLPLPVRSLALSGQARGSAAFGGTTEHPSIGGRMTMQDGTVVGARAPRLEGDFEIAAGRLTTTRTTLEAATGRAVFNGAVALEATAHNDWALNLSDVSTDLVLGIAAGFMGAPAPLNGGTLSGTVRCRGEWRQPDAAAELMAASLRVGREPLERVTLKASTMLPRWQLQLQAVHGGEESLSIDAHGEGRERLEASIDTTPTNLAKWRGASRRRIVGTAALHGRLTGDLERPSGWLTFSGSGLGIRGYRIGNVGARADGQNGDWSARGEALDGALNMAATLRTQAALPYTLNVAWRDAELARLLAGDASLHVVTTGEVALTGSVREPGAASGSIVVSQFEARRDEYRIGCPEAMRIDIDRGHFRIRSLIMEGQGSRLTVSGEWATTGQVDVRVGGNADLVLLELIGAPFLSSRGEMEVAAHLQRMPGTAWDLNGHATVRDAALDLGLPVVWTDTNGDFALSRGGIRIDHFAGKVGGGEFQLGGSVDLNHGPDVSWSLRDVALNAPEWLEERVSGRGQVTGQWQALRVSGDVEVLNALYDRRLELTDLVPWFTAQVTLAPRTEAAPRQISLDLHIHAPGGLFIDNNFAKVEMRCDLRIAGTTEKPALTGTVELIGGEIIFRDRTFLITGGALEFRDPSKINPIINISGESRISTNEADYTITMVVTGTADNPRVQFSADDPSLSQNDVLSLVATGKTMAQLQREGGGVNFGDVLKLVPTSPVEQRFRTLLGVDRFEIEPAYSRDTGALEPRVTIGKDVTERLRVLGASGFGVDPRRSVQVEYRYSSRISLLGTWDEQTQAESGAFGGDIKFRYDFRRLPFSLLRGDQPAPQQTDAH